MAKVGYGFWEWSFFGVNRNWGPNYLMNIPVEKCSNFAFFSSERIKRNTAESRQRSSFRPFHFCSWDACGTPDSLSLLAFASKKGESTASDKSSLGQYVPQLHVERDQTNESFRVSSKGSTWREVLWRNSNSEWICYGIREKQRSCKVGFYFELYHRRIFWHHLCPNHVLPTHHSWHTWLHFLSSCKWQVCTSMRHLWRNFSILSVQLHCLPWPCRQWLYRQSSTWPCFLPFLKLRVRFCSSLFEKKQKTRGLFLNQTNLACTENTALVHVVLYQRNLPEHWGKILTGNTH